MQHLRHEDGTGHGGVEGLGSAAEVGDGDGAVTHSLTCGVRPRPSLPTTRTAPLESEGRGDGEPQRFCPSNRAPTTGRPQEKRSGTLSPPTLLMHPTHSSYKKKDRSQAVLLRGAGEERNCRWPFRQRARRGAEERNALTSDTSHASDSLQCHKKRPLFGGLSLWSWRESNPRPNK